MKTSACFISLDYVNFTSNLFSLRFKKKPPAVRHCQCLPVGTAFSFWNRMWTKPHGGSWINIWNFFDRVGTWILRFINLKNDVFVYPHGSSTCDSRVHLPNLKTLIQHVKIVPRKLRSSTTFVRIQWKRLKILELQVILKMPWTTLFGGLENGFTDK